MTASKHPSTDVFIGKHLTVEEEYSAGENTHVDDEGNVIAATLGDVVFDDDSREVMIDNHSKGVNPLDVGSIVIGRVTLVKDPVAIITIALAEKDGVARRIADTSAALGVARASKDFIRSMKEVYHIGDFVRAKVVGITPYSIEIATNEAGLGKVLSREKIVTMSNPANEVFPTVEKNTHPENNSRGGGRKWN